jgi:predicted methyltransferase
MSCARLLVCVMSAALIAPLGAREDRLAELTTAAHRPAAHIARNVYRHPLETLGFFGLREDMTVVEIWPGDDGWYTEILAPYLRERGKLYAANFDGSTGVEYFAQGAERFKAKLAARPDIYDKVEVTALMPPAATQAAPAGSADLVVTFRNLHNWVNRDLAEAMFAAMYTALKPGGVLGLVAHRGSPQMIGKEAAKTGYLAESEAIRLAEAAGFKLVEKSEINANPRDTRDHPGGVWTLPPSFRLGEVDRAKYAAIGESDRMTMKFVKP